MPLYLFSSFPLRARLKVKRDKGGPFFSLLQKKKKEAGTFLLRLREERGMFVIRTGPFVTLVRTGMLEEKNVRTGLIGEAAWK